MILLLFPAYLCYCELLWQHFLPVHSKLQLYHLGSNIPVLHVPPQKVTRKFSGLEEHSRTLHHTPTQHLCIHCSKINAPFSQNFSLNHRINTETPGFCGRIKLTKNVILLSLPRPLSEKTILKTQCFALIFLQKLLFHGHCHWVK
jgi:hypothetical protein